MRYDIEYSTQYRKEVEYLKSCGIPYNYVKRVDEVPTYKYTKCQRLFELLAFFYGEVLGRKDAPANVKEV